MPAEPARGVGVILADKGISRGSRRQLESGAHFSLLGLARAAGKKNPAEAGILMRLSQALGRALPPAEWPQLRRELPADLPRPF